MAIPKLFLLAPQIAQQIAQLFHRSCCGLLSVGSGMDTDEESAYKAGFYCILKLDGMLTFPTYKRREDTLPDCR